MGSGTWRTSVYSAASATRTAKGLSDFNYSDSGATKVHDALKPAGLDGKGVIRESRDSDGHPLSVPVMVITDVTGSMRDVPRKLMKALPKLFGLILRKGYVTDPQILFGAVGDATCDRAPLQMGQFESDNRSDEDLMKLLLEGGGGGQQTESYELAMFFAARRTVTDAWEKRGRRGYLFIIGDEMAYPRVKAREVRDVIGEDIGEDIALADMYAELTERWDTYFIIPEGASYVGDSKIVGFWQKLLGQNMIQLADLDAICETIALTIGLAEEATDLDTGLADLASVGSGAGGVVGKALATLGSAHAGGAVVSAPAPGDLDTGASGNTRL